MADITVISIARPAVSIISAPAPKPSVVISTSGKQGLPGPRGPQGETGPIGPVNTEVAPHTQDIATVNGLQAVLDALAAPRTYHHIQGVASDTWTINHGLNKRPSVHVEDSLGDDVEGEVSHPDLNTTVLTFSAPFSGTADLN